jgi:diaminopimelate epimerase
MKISFVKYHGAGNDFILVDSREIRDLIFTPDKVQEICRRHTGVGADGIILLQDDESADFRMKFYNPEGPEGTMCGNGGRCITAFAHRLGIIKDKAVFSAIDGLHEARFMDNGNISLKMIDVTCIEFLQNGYLIDSGSMHFVCFRNDLKAVDIVREGKGLLYQKKLREAGASINFIKLVSGNVLSMRTYETGVWDETLSCGTGAVAAAISAYSIKKTDKFTYVIHAPGGDLSVKFKPEGNAFKDVWLEGPAEYVFAGELEV